MTTRRERLERKLEKRREWAEGRREDAAERFERAHAATEHIPFGQPILVGHHSEKRHRAALARSDFNMSKGCESQAMAEHHESKADGLERQLDNSIFSDDDDALEQLAAKIKRLEAERERNNAINKIVRAKPKNEPTPDKLAQLVALFGEEVTDAKMATAAKLFEPDFCGRIGIPSYVNQNLGGNIGRLKKRMEYITAQNERSAAASAAPGGVVIENAVPGQWCRVTFAEKPDRDILDALKAAGFRWGAGSWCGPTDGLPAAVLALSK